mmetsp:Transcript_7338/g.8294  ORF Transcript_7338/g.8294 Transcript_7338/m.8294 type:complete len:100 (+) Transcript_7338:629-928(+)
MIKEQQRKFLFQLSFKFEFDDEYYDEWHNVTLACSFDWYDFKNEIKNSDILREYIRNQYVNYFRKIILGPTLSVVGAFRTRLINESTIGDESMDSNLMM